MDLALCDGDNGDVLVDGACGGMSISDPPPRPQIHFFLFFGFVMGDAPLRGCLLLGHNARRDIGDVLTSPFFYLCASLFCLFHVMDDVGRVAAGRNRRKERGGR
jgi:hypothetical protein